MSLTEEIDKSVTSCIACTHADADYWDGLEDWKLFDDLAWKNLEKVVNELFSDKTKVVKTIRHAYRLSFWLMRIQSNASVQKTVLNHSKMYCFAR